MGDSRKWRSIAEQVTKETDSRRLMQLVEELCQALDGNDPRRPSQSVRPENAKLRA
jgi:hypothetical protein